MKHSIKWDKDDRIWIVKVPDLPGCMTHGDTLREALINKDRAIKAWLHAKRMKEE